MNPRSTVATTTEIYDYLRLLYAHVGQPHCPDTGVPIVAQTTSDIVDKILALPPKTKVMLLAPVVRGQKGEFRDVIERLQREGFVRARVDGELVELDRPECPRETRREASAHDRSGRGPVGDGRQGARAAAGFGGDGAAWGEGVMLTLHQVDESRDRRARARRRGLLSTLDPRRIDSADSGSKPSTPTACIRRRRARATSR